MTKSDDGEAERAHDLRARAEELVSRHVTDIEAPAPEEVQRLVYELEVHRAELEMQNQELRAAQQRLETSRDRYADLYDFAPLGYVTLDAPGLILDINLTAARLLGKERSFLIGHPFASHVVEEDRSAFRKHVRECVGGHEELTCDIRLAVPDGPSIPVHLCSIPVGDAEEGRPGCRTAITDITDRQRMEEELRGALAGLARSNEELEAFAYTASHDLKAPLITIAGFLGRLEKDAKNGNAERIESDVSRIAKATEKMHRLLDGLLRLSRIGRVTDPSENVSLAELAGEAAELLAGALVERGVHVEISPDLPTVHGERATLEELLMNLLSNAAKFMGDQPQPRVEVGARRDGDETVCYVWDNGMGIDARHKDRIFGLFNRLDHDGNGTGIGLAIAKRIVEVHGGRIWVESEGTGKGSTFCFTLERTEWAVAEEEQDDGHRTVVRVAC